MSRIIIKNKKAIDKMREGGHLLACVMDWIKNYVVSGVSTMYLNDLMEEKMRSLGLKPACKGYSGYQYATLISINDVIVHGIPAKEIILKSGDFVKIDVVGQYQGYCVDMARYFLVGEVNDTARKLGLVAQRALDVAIAMIKPGIRLSDISWAIQQEVEREGFGVVRDFAGHGIGKTIHEAPDILNYGKPGRGPILQEGMTLAIEPMITEKSYEVTIMADGWTAKTVDGGLAAHVEDTIVVTKNGAEVLTRLCNKGL